MLQYELVSGVVQVQDQNFVIAYLIRQNYCRHPTFIHFLYDSKGQNPTKFPRLTAIYCHASLSSRFPIDLIKSIFFSYT